MGKMKEEAETKSPQNEAIRAKGDGGRKHREELMIMQRENSKEK